MMSSIRSVLCPPPLCAIRSSMRRFNSESTAGLSRFSMRAKFLLVFVDVSGHRSQGRAESPRRAIHFARAMDWRLLRMQAEVIEQFLLRSFHEVNRQVSFDFGLGAGSKRAQNLPVDLLAGRQ